MPIGEGSAESSSACSSQCRPGLRSCRSRRKCSSAIGLRRTRASTLTRRSEVRFSGATGNHLLIPSLTAFDPERSPLRIPMGPPRLFIGFVLTEHATSIPRREFRGTPRQARQVIYLPREKPRRSGALTVHMHVGGTHRTPTTFEPGPWVQTNWVRFILRQIPSILQQTSDQTVMSEGSVAGRSQRNHTLRRSVDDFRSRSAPPFHGQSLAGSNASPFHRRGYRPGSQPRGTPARLGSDR